MNLPSKFEAFLNEARKFQTEGTTLFFGLEDVSAYGRTLTIFLNENGLPVKHTNALLVAKERSNQNFVEKSDSVDAECAARVLLNKFRELPNAKPNNKYWVLRSLVIRRDFLIKNNTCLKMHLHSLLTQHYPNYQKFFSTIGCKTSLAFFMRYPSPDTLKNTSLAELTDFLFEPSQGKVGAVKAQQILETIQDSAYEVYEFQEMRDLTVKSTIRQIEFTLREIERIEENLAVFLEKFDCTLTTMNGINVVTASQLLSCIGDIKKFPTPAKLARYSGIAPITYASGKKDNKYSTQRGKRELNSLFYNLAVRVSFTVGSTNKVINPFFHDYYNKKLSEGKTKRQALKCVQRRLVNIIWTMLTNNEEYVNPPMYDLPKEEKLKNKA
jgi:transposase